MAREYAQVRVSVWDDDDFVRLSPAAQHLYFLLVTSPSLSYAGVTDWRPNRIAKRAGGWTAEAVQAAADELSADLYVVVDEETEEVLVRSFIRNDGLLKQPRMAVAVARAWSEIASTTLRGVVVHELHRLRRDFPDLSGWGSPKATELLTKASVDPSGLGSRKGFVTGSVDGFDTPTSDDSEGSIKGPGKGSPTPLSLLPTPNPTKPMAASDDATATTATKRGTRAPDDFEVTSDLRDWASRHGVVVDLDRETELFLNHHRAKGTVFKDWRAAWRTWMGNSVKFGSKPAAASSRPAGYEFGL